MTRSLFSAMVAVLALGACEGPPEACERLCALTLEAHQDCMDRDGESWVDTYAPLGWPDANSFVGACETWAWEGRQLQRDAWWRGERGGHDLAETCEARSLALQDDTRCEQLEDLGWDLGWDLPWEDDHDGA